MNILTIDIDYAFSPSISQYDDFVIGSRIDYDEQQKILKQNNCSKPVLNKVKFYKLKEIINKFKNETKIVAIDHHHEILEHIKTFDNIVLQNIDHHHDIFYPGWHDIDKLDEGNWVYHLSQLSKLKEYTWFRNYDSEDFCKIDVNFIFNEIFNLDLNQIKKPDIIVICSSPHWTSDVENLLISKLLEA